MTAESLISKLSKKSRELQAENNTPSVMIIGTMPRCSICGKTERIHWNYPLFGVPYIYNEGSTRHPKLVQRYCKEFKRED